MAAGRFSVETVFHGIDQISSVIRKIEARTGISTRRMRKMFRQVDRGFSSLVSGAGKVARATAGIGLAAGVAAAALGKSGADFEQAITAVGAVGLQSRDQIAALEAKARELGSETKFTATEAANAMEIMARAGFENQEIIAGVGGVLDAASASGLEIADVANHVSNALKGMGLEVTDAKTGMSNAAMVADVLALASSKTNSSIGSLGESLKNVSATARQLDVKFHEAVAGVALLQDVGLDASVAGSAMNTMLTNLAKPPPKVAREMKRLGLSFKRANGDMKSFPEVLETISKASDAAGGNMDKVAFLADLVGLRGQKAAANLAELFEKGDFTDLDDKLKKAAGSAKEMSKLRLDNLRGDITKLGSAVDDVKISLFETQSEGLRGIVTEVKDWVTANKGLAIEKFERFVVFATELANIFGSEFSTTLSAIGEGFATMFPPSEETAGEWTLALKALARNLGQIVAVATVVAVGVATVIAGIVLLVSTVWSVVREVGAAITTFLGDRLSGFLNWFADLKAMFSAEGISLSEKLFNIGKQIVLGILRGIVSLKTAPIDAIRGIGSGVLKALRDSLGIRSPSQKMKLLGQFTTEGFTEGIVNRLPSLAGAFGQMAQLGGAVLGGQPAPQLASPSHSTVDGEIIVTAGEGTRAEVAEQPSSSGIGLRVAHTGAF